jgi:hypothetical protein
MARNKKRRRPDNEADAEDIVNKKPARRWYANLRLWTMVATVLSIMAGGGWGMTAVLITAPLEIKGYKTPDCGNCDGWIAYLERYGFKVVATERDNLAPIKNVAGISRKFLSTHTAFIGGYTIEGPVPAAAIRRLLYEKPNARGLVVAGSPGRSPGVEGAKRVPFEVLIFDAIGGTKVYARS